MVLAALLTIAYVEYSSNIAAVVKGTVTVANGYGSPAVVEFFTISGYPFTLIQLRQ